MSNARRSGGLSPNEGLEFEVYWAMVFQDDRFDPSFTEEDLNGLLPREAFVRLKKEAARNKNFPSVLPGWAMP